MADLLIVEDDQNIRETLRDILELAGYNVRVSSNGKEGYKSILTHKPDLVLCDVNMPELDGFELLGAINQRMKNEVMPSFLFLTARTGSQDVRHGMRLGADDYILKPFDHTEVLEIIELRLNKRNQLMGNSGSEHFKDLLSGFDKLAIPCEDGLMLVAFDQIVRCQAERSYCRFHLKSGEVLLVSKAMKEFEPELLQRHFLKVHRSNIVNVYLVEKYVRGKGGYLLLSDGSHVDVSARKKEEVISFLKPS